MKMLQNSSIFLCLLLIGCATNNDYQTYVDTKKALNKDNTMVELARISALVELAKDSQNTDVRIQAINALKDIQRAKNLETIDRPKFWLER